MKKILIATENLYCGGVEKCLIELLDSFDYESYKVELLLFNELGDLIDKVNPKVEVKYIIPENKFSNKVINKIYKSLKTRLFRRIPRIINFYISKNEYDIEIAYMHGYITNLVSNIIDDSNKIAWIHTDIEKCDVAKNSGLEKSLEKFNHIICVSNGVKEGVDKLSPSIKAKTKVIYNIINKDSIKKLSMERIDYEFDNRTIIGVGRFYKVKRFDLLIKAHKLLLDDGINNKLILVGRGGAEREYRQLISELGVEKSVDVLGYKENPYPYILKSDVFVLSSDHEGLPTVICEAMSLGKPIVATQCSGAIELVDDNKYGILTKCGDEENLKNSIKILLTNNDLLTKYSTISEMRSDIFNKYTVMKQIEDVLIGM